MRKVLFIVSGGLGKNIMATAVAKQIKDHFQDCILHVQCSYPDVFVNLPFVDKAYPWFDPRLPNVDFYEAHLDFDVLETEPYKDLSYRQAKSHLVDSWCSRIGIAKPLDILPKIELADNEIEWANAQIKQLNLPTGIPLIAFQPFGGTSLYQPDTANDLLRQRQVRNLPVKVAQEIVNKITEKGIPIIQISLPTEPKLDKTLLVNVGNGQVVNPRLMFATLSICKAFVGIDSFGQHAWKALGKSDGIVCWGATDINQLGYKTNKNLLAKSVACNIHPCKRPDGHMGDILANGQLWQCPKKSACMEFKAEDIIETLFGVLGVQK